MQPSVWGKHIWYSIHYIALAYPTQPSEQEKQDMRIFMTTLGEVLPCKTCRINFKEHLEELPLDEKVLSSKNTLFEWTVKLHNMVNESTGKTVQWTVEDALKFYKNYTGKLNYNVLPSCKTSNCIIVCIALLCTVLVVMYTTSKNK